MRCPVKVCLSVLHVMSILHEMFHQDVCLTCDVSIACDVPSRTLCLTCNASFTCDFPQSPASLTCNVTSNSVNLTCHVPSRSASLTCDVPSNSVKFTCAAPSRSTSLTCDVPPVFSLPSVQLVSQVTSRHAAHVISPVLVGASREVANHLLAVAATVNPHLMYSVDYFNTVTSYKITPIFSAFCFSFFFLIYFF